MKAHAIEDCSIAFIQLLVLFSSGYLSLVLENDMLLSIFPRSKNKNTDVDSGDVTEGVDTIDLIMAPIDGILFPVTSWSIIRKTCIPCLWMYFGHFGFI